jgi:eukaryotic-like serine/threonine-protein kinase
MPPMNGRVIAGRYTLLAPIGRGAMGVVWRARDQLLDRDVAVKEVVLSAAIGEDERRNAYKRTLREARTAARLSHHGVVTVYDVVEEDGRPWIVMELVPSRSLDQVIADDGPMTPLRAGRMGRQLLAALAHAHAAGVLHRDVKPSNVLIATDRSGGDWGERAVLTDFGIAQFEGDPRLTQTGMVMGSPGFTAPERIRGGDATPASDLWSLGATIYSAVEGRGPFEARGGAITTMSAIINEDAPVAPSAGQLGPLIAALLRREPSARPSASVAARMFADVLPMLPDGPAHSATVRSTYAPPPAPPAASSAPPALSASGAPAAPAVWPAAAQAAEAEEEEETPTPAKAAEVDAAAVGVAAAVGAAAGVSAAAAEEEHDAPAEEAVSAEVSAPAASAATLLDAGSAEPETLLPSREATVIDRSAAIRDVAPPAGDPAPSADAKLAASAPPTPTERVFPAPPPPGQPKPTFTAAKPGGQAGPSSFPGSRSPAPVPPQPAPSHSVGWDRPGSPRSNPPNTPAPPWEPLPYNDPGAPYGASGGQYGGSNAQYPGSNAQYPGSNAQYAGPSAQYAGPSQAYPDLARQYAPGAGGSAPRRSGRGRLIALVAAAILLAALIGGGAAYLLHHKTGSGSGASTTGDTKLPANLPGSVKALDDPTNGVPAGWKTVQIQPSDLNTTAGFTINVPPGWSETRTGDATKFYSPDRTQELDVDLTAHSHASMVAEAEAIEQAQVAQGDLPGYKRASLKAVPIRNTTGAFWQFTWTHGGLTVRSDDLLFNLQTPAGTQSYALYFRAPNNGWNSTWLPIFEKSLHSFETLT